MLLAGQAIHITYWDAVKLTYIGLLFNTALPGAVTGDVVKGYYIIREQGQKQKIPAIATILLDRFVGLSGLILVAGASLVLNAGMHDSSGSLAIKSLQGLVTGLGIVVLAFYAYVMVDFEKDGKDRDPMRFALNTFPRLQFLVNIYDAIRIYRHHPGILFRTVFASVVVHLFAVTSFILLAGAMHESGISLPQYFLLVPLGLITTALPVAPGGIGVGHAAFLALFHLVGSRRGADIFTLFVGFALLLNLCGVFFYLGYRQEMPPELARQ